MANKNVAWFNEFGNKYGVSYQILMSKNGTVAQAIIGHTRHNGLGQLNKAQLEELFKSNGKTDMDNNVTISDKGTVTINGRKYTVWDIIKDVKPTRLFTEYLYKEDMNDSQKQVAEKIKAWLYTDNNFEYYLLCNLKELDYGLTAKEVTERKEDIKQYIKELVGV